MQRYTKARQTVKQQAIAEAQHFPMPTYQIASLHPTLQLAPGVSIDSVIPLSVSTLDNYQYQLPTVTMTVLNQVPLM
jgi:hypothetical protein